MKRRTRSFNIYFALLCVVMLSGCAWLSGTKKEQTTIRLYIEGQRADRATAGMVQVTSNKFSYTVERVPFLDEGDLSKASIVNDPAGDGGYSIQLKFNDHGTLLLDMYTADNLGRHIIVFSQFPTPGAKAKKAHKKSDPTDDSDLVEPGTTDSTAPGEARQSGWIAAVLIRNRISNGLFRFTPDASRAEGNRIVRGLRNVIPKQEKLEKF